MILDSSVSVVNNSLPVPGVNFNLNLIFLIFLKLTNAKFQPKYGLATAQMAREINTPHKFGVILTLYLAEIRIKYYSFFIVYFRDIKWYDIK